ncbi:hypothetical protein NMY22_g12608 [Coprinellus aureogranulatus]|nr:hypothetical protein NMY22_g12608 [Coprinellus aureogranulatus]
MVQTPPFPPVLGTVRTGGVGEPAGEGAPGYGPGWQGDKMDVDGEGPARGRGGGLRQQPPGGLQAGQNEQGAKGTIERVLQRGMRTVTRKKGGYVPFPGTTNPTSIPPGEWKKEEGDWWGVGEREEGREGGGWVGA